MLRKLRDLISLKGNASVDDSDRLCTEAAIQSALAIKAQIKFACHGGEMSHLTTDAGSVQSVAYMLGYCKAAHRFYENNTQIHINDGTMRLGAISSVFRENSLEECLAAIDQTCNALEQDVPGTRQAFEMGIRDYDTLGDGAINGNSGLIAILVTGRTQ
jgi:hypothetical protein